MAIRCDFSGLQVAANKMGEYETDFEIELDGGFEEVEIDLRDGRSITSDDIEITSGGLISAFGQQAVLYIPDQGSDLEEVLGNGVKSRAGKRVHLAKCSTIESMTESGRFERYVARNGLSQEFVVHGHLHGRFVRDRQATLAICRNCMSHLNYKDYRGKYGSSRDEIVEQFSYAEFFTRYSSYFKYKPKELSDKYAENTYVEGWKQISSQMRRAAHWSCIECKVNLKERKNLLHVHHENGNRNNNDPDNLKVLCVDCHSKAPMHESMFVSLEHRKYIQSLRIEQGLYKRPLGSGSEKAWIEAFEQSDTAVHDLLLLRKRNRWPAPEVGGDVADRSGEIIYSNAELIWEGHRVVVDIEDQGKAKLLSIGWRFMTVAEALNAT